WRTLAGWAIPSIAALIETDIKFIAIDFEGKKVVEILDAVIIGGGPAGLSCALELHDSKVSNIVIERRNQLGGSLSEIKNTVRTFTGGFFENGEELRLRLVALVEKMKLPHLLNANVETVELEKGIVYAAGHQYIGRTIVLATGVRFRRLPAADAKPFKKDVYYYTEGRESEFDGKTIAVIGGGDSALMECLGLSEKCKRIFLIHRNDRITARPDVIDAVEANSKVTLITNSILESINGNDETDDTNETAGRLTSIAVSSVKTGALTQFDVDKLVVKVGYAPNTELFRGQVQMDKDGHIIVDQFGQTSLPNVLAIGDMTTPSYPRIAAATGQGSFAAARIRSILGAR
ncbi:MAG TPA: NAD(P)/FAD-dependent oxidoreductase, partial [Chroococcales cyanobacterium]